MNLRIALMLRQIDEPGGTAVYNRRITEALLRVDPENEYLLVFASAAAASRWSHLSARSIVVEARSKLLWDQVTVPRALARERVDVVFSLKHSIPLAPFAPRVFIMHGAEWVAFPQDYYPLDRLYHRLALPLYLRAAERVITISHDSAERIVAYMPSAAGKLSVVHHGVGPSFRPVTDLATRKAARLRLGLPKHFLLYVGQVYPHKNVGGILRAFGLLRDRLPHDLVLVGRRHYKAEQDLQLIGRLALEDRVRLIDWLPEEELRAFYSLADAFVFPSLFEGFGLPLLEAMACGCPVITSTVGACPEVVGDAGLCVDPVDPEAIAAAVERVVTNQALAAELRRHGIERAREFTWERAARATLATLVEAAGRSPRTSVPATG